MPDSQDHLDLLIDSALSTYAEPRAGLETRVRTNISAHLTTRPAHRRWLGFAIALPIAACLILLLLLVPRHNRIEPVHQAQNTPVPPAQSAPQTTIARTTKTPARTPQPRLIAAHAPLPKLDVFPTPQPLSPEEQALAHFVAHTPPSEIKSLQDAQQKLDEPLNIAEIQIQPIKPSNPPDKSGN
jgi:hypothetical protein